MKKYGDIFYKFLWIWLILVQIGCTNQSELKVIKPIVLPESDTVLNGNVYRAKVYIENADQLQNALLNADGISYSFKYNSAISTSLAVTSFQLGITCVNKRQNLSLWLCSAIWHSS